MTRFLLAAMGAALLAASAHAHFVFVVPQKDGTSVQVVFSDDLNADENVSIDKIASLKLTCVGAAGKESPAVCNKGKHHLDSTLGEGTQVVYGSVAYGLFGRGDAPPSLLVYHPKAVIGTPGKSATVGPKAELEAVPVVVAGKVRFRLLAKGQPVANAEGSALLPDGMKAKLKTDKEGYTAEFDAAGRYGIWLRNIEKKAGEHDGKKYEKVSRYATLVFDNAKP